MKNLILLLCVIFSLSAVANTSTSRIEEIESRLDDMELNQVLNKFHFSGTITNHFESYHEVNKRTDLFDSYPTGVDTAFKNNTSERDNYLSPFILRAEVSLDAYITKNLTFFSTIGMTKFWNMSGRTSRSPAENQNFQSLSGGYKYQDSSAHFDVAYLRFHQKESPWTFAIGRMTTNNGPPHNKLDGRSRTGTYPFLSYNVILDGVAGIYNFKKLVPQDHSLKVRLFYTPFITVDKADKNSQYTDDADSGSTGKSGDRVDSNGFLATLLTEYSVKNLKQFSSIDLFHSLYHFEGFYDPTRQKPEPGSFPATSAYEPYMNAGVEYSGTTANTIYLGLNGISQTGLDISYTYTTFIVRNTSDDDETSQNHLCTASYRFDNKFNGGHIAGIEYLEADENKVPTDSTTLYVNEFYNMINGKGSHFYYTVPVGSHQVFRVGYFKFKSGESDFLKNDIESDITSTYGTWKVFF